MCRAEPVSPTRFLEAQDSSTTGRKAQVENEAGRISPVTVEPSPQDTQKQLLDLINQMPESELVGLRLGQVAEHLSCCERHTSRLFRAVCGRSLRVYVSELRLKKACSLLAQGSRKVIDVALESGYGSPAQFNHVFKQRFGMTPTQWRERYQAGRGCAAKGQPWNQPAGIV